MINKAVTVIDRVCAWVGRGISWATLFMVLTTATVVLLRDVFQVGWIWLQEVSVYLHALVFLLGAAYTLQVDEHVRVDLFYRGYSQVRKRWVNTIGTLCFLIPTMLFILWASWDYVLRSWVGRETSHETGGLVYPWPSLLKTSILVACILLVLQGISILMRAWLTEDSVETSDGKVRF